MLKLPAIKSPKGFTLIEIVIAITIVAILSVIGLTSFNAVQGGSRDARRKQELDLLAKTLESSKNHSAGTYTYTTAQANIDFADKIPTDPNSANGYCVATATGTAPPAVATTRTATGCPSGGSTYGLFTTSIGASGGLAVGTAKSWTLCVNLERNTTPYCVSSATN